MSSKVALQELAEFGFDPTAQARARARRKEITAAKLAHRTALIATALAIGPVSKPLLDLFIRVISIRWLAVLVYTYSIVTLVRWSLPPLFIHVARMDFRDGLLPELPRGWIFSIVRNYLLVMLVSIPFFAFIYGLSFSPWHKTDWSPVLYAAFVSMIEIFSVMPQRGGLRSADEALKRRAEKLARWIKVKSARLKYLEVPERAPGGAAYLTFWFWDAIVLTQNLCDWLTPEELDVVLSHELAHRKEGWALALIFGVRVLGLVIFVGPLLPLTCDLYGIYRFGIEALPLFIALCELGLVLVSPLEMALMRWAERRADRLALKASGNPTAFASAMIKLYDGNLIDAAPSRLWQLFFGSHPTGLERVKLAWSYSTQPNSGDRHTRQEF